MKFLAKDNRTLQALSSVAAIMTIILIKYNDYIVNLLWTIWVLFSSFDKVSIKLLKLSRHITRTESYDKYLNI